MYRLGLDTISQYFASESPLMPTTRSMFDHLLCPVRGKLSIDFSDFIVTTVHCNIMITVKIIKDRRERRQTSARETHFLKIFLHPR